MRLYLIRHGESEGNKLRLIFGHADHPLTDNGIEHAQLAAEKLRDIPIARCYTSTLKRASHTAEICFGNRNIPIIYLDDLREQYMGDWENQTFNDLAAQYPLEFPAMMNDWINNAPLNGEHFDEVYNRVTACVDEIIKKGEDAAIVAHNGPLSMMTAHLLRLDKKCVEQFYFLHGCYSCFIIGDGYKKDLTTLACFNK